MSWTVKQITIHLGNQGVRLRLKCDGTRAETRFRPSAKRASPFKSAVASVQSTTGSRGVCISGSNAGYTMFRSSVRVLATHSIRQFPLHFPPPPCVIVCHHVSTGLQYVHAGQLLSTNLFKAEVSCQ
jgi:hypothetical protein